MVSRRRSSGSAKARSAAVTSEPAGARSIGNHLVPVEAVFHVPAIAPAAKGPWTAEAEKVAWRDEMSGYGCIMRRSAKNGVLHGYVGVGPDHPLFNFTPKAIESLGVHAHGGLNYARPCQDNEPEWRSVCHVGNPTGRVRVAARFEKTYANEASGHDDMWWVGFSCDQPDDILPNDPKGFATESPLDGVTPRVYRDEAFVYEQCVRLAAQFKEIAEGRDPAEVPSTGQAPKAGR